MKKESRTTSQESRMKFAEAGILIALVAALTIFVGVKVADHGDAEQADAAVTVSGEVAPATEETGVTLAVAAPETLGTAAESAVEAVAAAAAPETPRTPVTYAEAEKIFFAGRYQEAADLFADYTAGHGENAWGFYMLGLSAWKAGDPDAADEAFRRALDLKPEHLKSLVNHARVLLEMDRAEEARDRIEMALAVDPSSLDALRVLGRIQHSQGELDAAAESYRTVLADQADDVWALNNLGLILIEQEKFADALAPLARASLIRGDLACVQNNLGIALERTGHYTAADEAYALALQADPAHGKALISRTRVAGLISDDPAEAVDLAALAAGFAARPQSVSLEADMEVASAPLDSAPVKDDTVTNGSRNR